MRRGDHFFLHAIALSIWCQVGLPWWGYLALYVGGVLVNEIEHSLTKDAVDEYLDGQEK